MKGSKLFCLNYLLLIYLEFVFSFLLYDNYLKISIINRLLFLLLCSFLLTFILGFFKKRVNKIIIYIFYSILSFWFSLEYIFKQILDSYFSLSLFKLTDQVLKFGTETVLSILKNSYALLIFFLPLVVLIVFRKKISIEKHNLKTNLVLLILLPISGLLFYGNILYQKNIPYGGYELYYDVNDNILNIERFGIINATIIDLKRTIFGYDVKIKNIDEPKKEVNEIFEYDYNITELNFSKFKNGDSDIALINSYLQKTTGTQKNRYTGIFKNKNLIYITAESFSDIAVSKELTPTLYKMIHDGFEFNNFYVPYNLSTIGGEFQSLTGLYADSSILSIWRSGKNSFPFGLANMFKKDGYNTYAYHNHYYDFQDRNKYLNSIGFNNYKGCYNGLEKLINCELWPESDLEMIDKTTVDYLNSDLPFLVYYMTVSGHFEYNWYNDMSKKNKLLVDNLNYSDSVKAYLSSQIELDKSLGLLINRLEDSNKLKDTVIVLLADHYPYGLSTDEINELSTYEKDSIIENNKSNLIIWNSELKKNSVDKVSMSIDVIPTVYNLFGLNYDSRLFMGKDIFSNDMGLAFFNNRSWVTDKGTYFVTDGIIKNSRDNISGEYIQNINNVISNRINLSKLIMKKDYYKYFAN